MFSEMPGQRICDFIGLINSWRWLGCSRVSCCAHHNEPSPVAPRQATPQEIYEHGRWEAAKVNRNKDMPARYNQWELVDCLAFTLCCM
jgi:hypothetical protein